MIGSTGRILTVGYPSLDHIARVERLGAPGETRIIEAPWPAPTPGGCAANVAVALAKLGLRAAASFAVGDDRDSRTFLDALSAAGVDVSGVEVRSGRSMPRSYLFLGRDGAELYFDPAAMRDWRAPRHLDLDGTQRVVVTVGPSDATVDVIRLAERRGIPVALQLKRDLTVFGPERLRGLLPHCDLVFANEDELAYLLGALGAADAPAVLALGPRWLVETRGAAGAVVHHQGGSDAVPVVPPGRVVEPTGAGDAFTAGVVYGLATGAPPLAAARIGAVLASFAVEGWGCQAGLPDLGAVRERYLIAFGEALAAASEAQGRAT